jgi:hypothetical protein
MNSDEIRDAVLELRSWSEVVWEAHGRHVITEEVANSLSSDAYDKFIPGYNKDSFQRRLLWSVLAFASKTVCAINGVKTEGEDIRNVISNCFQNYHKSFLECLQCCIQGILLANERS